MLISLARYGRPIRSKLIKIDLRSHKKRYHGFRSDVFIVNGRVYKVFKQYGDRNVDNRSEDIFAAQCDAYERISREAELNLHIPDYFGMHSVSAIVDADGKDMSTRYDLSRCYALEELHGCDRKINEVEIRANHPYIQAMRDRFEEMSVDTGDASVFYWDDQARFKLIDVTSKNF